MSLDPMAHRWRTVSNHYEQVSSLESKNFGKPKHFSMHPSLLARHYLVHAFNNEDTTLSKNPVGFDESLSVHLMDGGNARNT
jgi:hypothetical protein